jgi:hypothetical protein
VPIRGNWRPEEGEQIADVPRVHDREALGQAERRAVTTQHPVGYGVKGPRFDASCNPGIHQLASPSDELGCRPTAEGDKQYPLGRCPVLEQACKPADQGPGLSGAGTSDDTEGSAVMIDGPALLGVQPEGPCGC